MKPAARTLAIGALALALTGCGVLDSLQRELIFRPVTEDWRGYGPGILGHEPFWIPVGTDGERLHAWWVPALGTTAPDGAPAMLYLHGARVNLSGSVYRLRRYARMGFNVLAIDYRGYGRSSARLPSETSVSEDARAAWEWLAARVADPRRRVIYGHSLGGAIAAGLAADVGPAGALVLESTFTSIRDIAARSAFGILPLDALLTQHFEVPDKLARVRMPVLIVQGSEDSLVPPEMAHRLHAVAPEPKRLLIAAGAGHRWVIARVGDELERTLWAWTCGAADTPIGAARETLGAAGTPSRRC
ncbi:MAG: alpha/beta fold hydrolase [Burkholderiales bacterium]|nr:MAG: alpha/beta fold hydrolase [Burkholderiales bacterium]